jgi:hypothetical protein
LSQPEISGIGHSPRINMNKLIVGGEKGLEYKVMAKNYIDDRHLFV